MPLPQNPNGGQSALEQAAIAARNVLLARNTYNNEDQANEYSATHTRAISDSLTPIYGKGTGFFLDINNYNGGGSYDIWGNVTYAGSGRAPAFANNLSTWGYGPGSNYTAPDMSGNIGQVII